MRKWVEVLNFDADEARWQRDCFELDVNPLESGPSEGEIRRYTKPSVLIELELTDPSGLSLSKDREWVWVHFPDRGAYAVGLEDWKKEFAAYRKAVRLRRAGGNPRLALRHSIEDGQHIDLLASGWETVEYDTSINWKAFETALAEAFDIKDHAALSSFVDTANDLLSHDGTREDHEVLLGIFDLLNDAASTFGV